MFQLRNPTIFTVHDFFLNADDFSGRFFVLVFTKAIAVCTFPNYHPFNKGYLNSNVTFLNALQYWMVNFVTSLINAY